ncbi:hypothetical protein [Rosenbergiella australiborealis]|uniref:hypothetical protein n=1 Tax=Rosenbergiella australiborealis TaxID=1544696 RepID=UPI00387E238D
MDEVFSVSEYDLLGSGKATSLGVKLVPQLVFEYLETLSLTSVQGGQFILAKTDNFSIDDDIVGLLNDKVE